VQGRRNIAGAAVLVLVSGPVVTLAPHPASAFNPLDRRGDQMTGRAYGAYGIVTNPGTDTTSTSDDTTVKVGEVAAQNMSCNPILGSLETRDGESLTNTLNLVAGITVPIDTSSLLVRTATLKQTGRALATTTRSDSNERSVVQKVNILDGTITADLVQADAWTTRDNKGWHHHSAALQANRPYETAAADGDPTDDPWKPATGSTFLNLTVGGETLGNIAPDPNTRIDLPGLGYVVLNEQVMTNPKMKNPSSPPGTYYGSFTGVQVNAIHVYLFDDPATRQREGFMGYTGDLVVAHAVTRIAPAPGRISGFGYALRADVDPILKMGLVGILRIACPGTNGAVTSRPLPGIQVASPTGGHLVKAAALNATVSGAVVPTGDPPRPPYSESTDSVKSLSLLNGLITADAITSLAHTDASSSAVTSRGSSSLLNLVINGTPIEASVPPNTTVQLLADAGGPRIGRVILNEQRCYDVNGPGAQNRCTSVRSDGTNTHYDAITVYAIHILIDADNELGLPIGADVYVAVAHSDLTY
jgi:hypothetical protein